MSLKTLISSLIEATFTSKKAYIAKQALPANETRAIEVPLQNVSGWQYIPPDDGYLYIDCWSSGEVFLHSGILSYMNAGERKSLFIPVSKGSGVSVGSLGFLQDSQAKFFPLIGGGLKSLFVKSLCGGGLCLLSHLHKACSIFLQRKLISTGTFKQQALSGLQIKRFLKQRKLNTPSLAGIQLQRRLMVLRVYLLTARLIPQSKTQESHHEISTQRRTAQITSACDMLDFGYRLLKVQRLGLVLKAVQPRYYGATRLSAQPSICLQGGAL